MHRCWLWRSPREQARQRPRTAISGGGSIKDAPDAPVAVVADPIWDGFYIGGQAGLAYSDESVDVTSDSVLTVPRGGQPNIMIFEDSSRAFDEDGGGGFGGGHIGYNKQHWGLVFGIEADINASDIDLGSASTRSSAVRFEPAGIVGGGPNAGDLSPEEINFARGATSASAEVDWFGTLRGRIGIAKGLSLFYVTAGAAYGEVALKGNVELESLFRDASSAIRANQVARFDEDDTEWGWTIGAGFDHLVTPNVVLGFSYKYVDLGDVSAKIRLDEAAIAPGPPGRDFGLSDTAVIRGKAEAEAKFHTLQARISYLF